MVFWEMIISTNEFKPGVGRSLVALESLSLGDPIAIQELHLLSGPPLRHTSGTSIRATVATGGTRVSHIANKKMKKLLHGVPRTWQRYLWYLERVKWLGQPR